MRTLAKLNDLLLDNVVHKQVTAIFPSQSDQNEKDRIKDEEEKRLINKMAPLFVHKPEKVFVPLARKDVETLALFGVVHAVANSWFQFDVSRWIRLIGKR